MKKKDAQLGQLIKTYSGICIVLGVDADCIDKIRTALTYDLNNPLIKRDMTSMIEEYRKTVQVSCYVVCPRLDIKSDYIDKVTKEYAMKMAEHLLEKPLNEKRITTSTYMEFLGQVDKDKVLLWLLKSQMYGPKHTYMTVKEIEEKVVIPFLAENKEKLEVNTIITPDCFVPLTEYPERGEYIVVKTNVNYLFYLYLGKKYGKDYYLPIIREKLSSTLLVSRSILLERTSDAFKSKPVSIKHQIYRINLMYPDLERLEIAYDNI